jgi:hypothetical protein
VVLVAAATVDLADWCQPSLPRLRTDALMVPALKSRARINRRCRDEDVLLHLFFKDHKSRAEFILPQCGNSDIGVKRPS